MAAQWLSIDLLGALDRLWTLNFRAVGATLRFLLILVQDATASSVDFWSVKGGELWSQVLRSILQEPIIRQLLLRSFVLAGT